MARAVDARPKAQKLTNEGEARAQPAADRRANLVPANALDGDGAPMRLSVVARAAMRCPAGMRMAVGTGEVMGNGE